MIGHNHTSDSLKTPNLLIHEKSPYLLQHAYNPVQWHPWGEEAFEKARREHKPVFLSIGYSTCHWCHVMERESFEDGEAAALLNQTFVPIKVDREERPDVDNIYMNVCQAMTGGGGWPLTILMTPDRKPFFAGTYFPKSGRYGRIGLIELTRQIGEIWKDRHDEVLTTAEQIVQAVREAADSFEKTDLGREDIETAFKHLESRYDPQYGGFSTQPKFPTPHNLLFLMRYHTRTGNKNALNMAEHTLREMRKGGIYDHIGFGFHRYSTDRRWLVPHFEKMLYDQAMLVMAYAELYQITGKEEYKKTAKEILTYVSRDMTHPEGGFYSAEDADSEGVEGKFYVWTIDELAELLGHEDAELASEIFSCEPAGNFLEESTQEKTGENILHLERTIREWREQLPLTEEELHKILSRIRGTLFAAREERIHPYKDDKIMTDWNGLMIAACAVAARVFDEPGLAEPAKQAARFILNTLSTEDGRLLHRYRDGEAGIPAFLDDYAFFVWGLLELYETTFRAEYLRQALRLKNTMLESFSDPKAGGLFFYPEDGEELITRQKEVYDGAIPSGNSVAMMNFLRLARITGDAALEERALEIQRYFGGIVRKTPSAFTQLLCAVDFAGGESMEIVIAGDIEDPRTKELIRTIRSMYLPHKVVIHKPAAVGAQEIEAVAGYLAEYREVDGKPAAYLCRNHACERPVTDVEELRKMLATADPPTLPADK